MQKENLGMDRQGDEIIITQQMIQAGVEELREKPIGLDLAEIVRCVYLMMEVERRSQG